MRVQDFMTSPVVYVVPTAALSEAISLMIDKKLSGLPVLENSGRLCGILSEGDLLRRVEFGSGTSNDSWWSCLITSRGAAEAYQHSNGRRVEDVMTKHPIVIAENDTLSEAARLMQKHRIKRLPVMRGSLLVGILSRADFVKALRAFVAPVSEEQATSDVEIRQRINEEVRQQGWSSNCEVNVQVHGGHVSLTGFVPTPDHQVAIQIAAENVDGVLFVDNLIVVSEPVLIPGF